MIESSVISIGEGDNDFPTLLDHLCNNASVEYIIIIMVRKQDLVEWDGVVFKSGGRNDGHLMSQKRGAIIETVREEPLSQSLQSLTMLGGNGVPTTHADKV